MRKYPEDKYDFENLETLNVDEWQLEALKMNPSYPHWGPYEDYMSGGKGWAENQFFDTWQDFGPWNLDELNECVHFYFYLWRKNHECADCEGSGLNPETKAISDAFYDFEGTGQRWCAAITQDEVEALVKQGRLFDFVPRCYFDEETQKWMGWEDGEKVEIEQPNMPTAQEVNRWEEKKLGHDAINRSILIKARAERLGVYGHCPECDGEGVVYDEPKGKLGIVLWFLHPQKGASRGVEVKGIQQNELQIVIQFLQDAAERNAGRFAAVYNKNLQLT